MALIRHTLGNTGIEVTELCFGSLILGHLQANMSPEEGAPVIRRALELGVNFIDTAKGYKTHAHVRAGLDGFDGEVVIASKSPVKDPREMREDVEACLRETGREVIDIYHLHLVRSHTDMKEREDVLDVLVKCREAGMIRAVGLTAHGPEGTLCALDNPEIEVVMPLLNRKGLGIIGGTHDEMLSAIREVHAAGIGIYDMKPLGGGHLIDDIPAAIEYLRDLEYFDSISVGLKTPEEVEVMVGVFERDAAGIERALEMGRDRNNKKNIIIYEFLCKQCGACVTECAQEALVMGDTKPDIDTEKCILCGYCAAVCPAFAIRVI